MKDRTDQQFGKAQDIGEKTWVRHYVEVRRDWLAHHSNTLLHKTVYRMDSFLDLIDDDNWTLNLPFTCRGVLVNEAALSKTGDPRPSSDEDEMRLLRLKTPFLRGDDVKAVQQALNEHGMNLDVDVIYGPNTEQAVRGWQRQQDLAVDGIVGPATRTSLGI